MNIFMRHAQNDEKWRSIQGNWGWCWLPYPTHLDPFDSRVTRHGPLWHYFVHTRTPHTACHSTSKRHSVGKPTWANKKLALYRLQPFTLVYYMPTFSAETPRALSRVSLLNLPTRISRKRSCIWELWGKRLGTFSLIKVTDSRVLNLKTEHHPGSWTTTTHVEQEDCLGNFCSWYFSLLEK